MANVELTELDILNGTFALIFVIISLFVGFRIFFKYFSLKRKELITVGLSWIFLSSGWWGAGFSFLSVILFDLPFTPLLYIALGNIFVPIAILTWIYSFATMVYPDLKNKIMVIFLLICIPYEIVLIYFLITDLSVIGVFKGIFFYQPSLLAMSFQIFAVLVALITGIIFSKKSLHSEDQRIRWKGRFLLMAFIFFTLGSVLDAALTISPAILVIGRLILAASAFEYYLGFLLPEKIADWLIK
ncbi:MAG: hypothetical protein GF383_10605 [Candidatus Lokiarchaeota archaeon]|nr:hypothetical protein [Candidatus Lokiarchaeota archaeon]MBD3341023.1 hypothetical protein [Candidatus Lokiarchaeota archaeon]